MWKTVSEACNLACDYCYYSTCNGKPGRINPVDDTTLEIFIKDYMAMSRGLVPFIWQGGEPLLAGYDFFEKVVTLQQKYTTATTRATNSIQTNGTLINQRWASFFKRHKFFVGVSLDGPQQINDKRRVTRTGKASFDLVMRGIEHLREQNVPFNILTVIHENNVGHAKELMAFYEQEQFAHVQFIPCMDFQAQHPDQPGVFSITPEAYGTFLCEAFDAWYNDGKPMISVRFFDNMVMRYLNQTAEHCIHQEACPPSLVFEQNGDAYPCDFYMDEDHCLGNIRSQSLQEILQHPKMKQFSELKPALSNACQSCDFVNLCYGGCPRNRRPNEDGENVEYFCASYQKIYKYAHERVQKLANQMKYDKLLAVLQAGYPMPKNHEPCLCGSYEQFETCCKPMLTDSTTN